jgi:hypothetical protein
MVARRGARQCIACGSKLSGYSTHRDYCSPCERSPTVVRVRDVEAMRTLLDRVTPAVLPDVRSRVCSRRARRAGVTSTVT